MPVSRNLLPLPALLRAPSHLQAHGTGLLRFGLGLVFVWFGAPKLVPGLSPAEELIAATVTCCDPSWFVPALGLAEIAIGIGLWVKRWTLYGLPVMAMHMLGTAMPLVLLPEITWRVFPVATLEGQYILKNIVLVAGAMVVAGAGFEAGRPGQSERRGSSTRETRTPGATLG